MKLKITTPATVFHHETQEETVSIGRATDNDFVIPLQDFSRKHCEIINKGNYFFIKDLGSKNGVIIDGRRIPPHQVFPVYRGMKLILANLFECEVFSEEN